MMTAVAETKTQTQIRKAGFGVRRALWATVLAPLALIWGCSGVAQSSSTTPPPPPPPPQTHSATTTWTASTSVVSGYNVYRADTSGGPYTKVSASLVAGVTYADSTVVSGRKYYYVITAVDASGVESVYSNEVPATIP